jgi:hypothetical protein
VRPCVCIEGEELAGLQGAGIDLRPMQSIYMFPTLVIFAEGKGIAGARALIEAGSDANGLDLYFRQDVRLYYRVRSDWKWQGFCIRNHFRSSKNHYVLPMTLGSDISVSVFYDDSFQGKSGE